MLLIQPHSRAAIPHTSAWRLRRGLGAVVLLALQGWGLASASDTGPIDFNRDIRPILAENCLYCHGQDAQKRQADLRLDVREGALAGGAVVPGNAGASSLVERIQSSDADVVMPPPHSNRRLSKAQKTLLSRWIASGAHYAPHWAFAAPQRPEPPSVQRADWPRQEIDRFILAGLEEAGLVPSPEADRPTLIRRLHADLIGLPPTPAEIDAFVADTDPQAYEKLVDRLLASPHYGERMALPWLDAARYADSNGFQQDGDTWQWMWRDWVVQSLNADMPFEQFSTEQLAGDLLPEATAAQKIASAFNRNHLLNGEGGAIAEEQRFNNLFDRVDTTATTWLGLTMACAQCHDHKYDPLTQRDYYGLLDAFNRVPETGAPTWFSPRIRVAPPVLELPTPENTARLETLEAELKQAQAEAQTIENAAYAGWRAGLSASGHPEDATGLPEKIADRLKVAEGERTPEEKAALEADLRRHFDEKVKKSVVGKYPQLKKRADLEGQRDSYRGDQIPRVMVMSDAQPRETKILERGDYLSPRGEVVGFSVPAFLPPLPPESPSNRLGLAQWLFHPEHPLTARVQVNRMWQHFFGAGLVKTAEDLGVQSEYPHHLPLLDWLAVEFQNRHWSMKQIHRLIVTSATYRQSSRLTPEHVAGDPENRLFARAARFRMPSMVLRDWALAASGLLDARVGGPPVYPYQPEQIWEALAITHERDFTYPASHSSDLYRRSLYSFWRRTVSPANMFDAANRQTCHVRGGTTCTPLHALTTLNDTTWVEASRVAAARCMQSSSDSDQRLQQAFRSVLGRAPTGSDMESLRGMLERQRAHYAADPAAAAALTAVGESPQEAALDRVEQAALAAVCLAIFNLDEALTRE